jgi:type II secretory pathway pseudopilin PulG
MLNKIKKEKKYRGFSLIEALVLIFIFTIISLAFYGTFSLGIRYIQDSKNRLGALALANEKMEIVRNLEYSTIGTTTGIPNGDLTAEEDVVVNNVSYHVSTFVQYIDDPFDDESPDDVISNDYKRVKITVSWGSAESDGQEIFLISRFVPPGLEMDAEGGILAINIINNEGIGVPQSQVRLINSGVSPSIDITALTDDSGYLIFPGAPESLNGYEITVTKDNYETVITVDPDSVLYLPNDPHASVIEGRLNTKTIHQDELSDINLETIDHLGSAVPNVDFHIEGGRVLGTVSADVPPVYVYNLDEDGLTNSSGEKDYEDMSPGQYFISPDESITGYTLVGISPASPIIVSPGSSQAVEIKYVSNTVDSLIVTVIGNEDSEPINGAEVKLSNGVNYDETITTSTDGIAFFPVDENPLLPGTYTLEISAEGFQDHSESVSISQVVKKEIIMIVE